MMSPTTTRHAGDAFLATRRKRAGLLQRDIAARLGARAKAVSSIETERAKHMATRDSCEALLNRIERQEIRDWQLWGRHFRRDYAPPITPFMGTAFRIERTAKKKNHALNHRNPECERIAKGRL